MKRGELMSTCYCSTQGCNRVWHGLTFHFRRYCEQCYKVAQVTEGVNLPSQATGASRPEDLRAHVYTPKQNAKAKEIVDKILSERHERQPAKGELDVQWDVAFSWACIILLTFAFWYWAILS